MTRKLKSSLQRSALIHWDNTEKRQVLVSDSPNSPKELVVGQLIQYNVKNSFSLSGGTSTELADYQVVSTAKKSVILVILLEGKLDISYDDLRFVFDASTGPTGVVVNLTKPATFRRIIEKGNHVTKLNIVIPIDWVEDRIESGSNVETFINQHMANCRLNLTDRLMALTLEIIHQRSPKGILEKMTLETLGYQFLFEIFEQIGINDNVAFSGVKTTTEMSVKDRKGGRSLDELVSYIEVNLDRTLPGKELAQYSAMSESNLQRKFKSKLGCSIQSYIRRRRLEIARQHLERGTASVTEVAYNAGYRHPSNFTNAFKKAFGYPPAVSANRAN
ncbi:helix-turn-helix transcriptional regulator [Vibrio sp. WJH972]